MNWLKLKTWPKLALLKPPLSILRRGNKGEDMGKGTERRWPGIGCLAVYAIVAFSAALYNSYMKTASASQPMQPVQIVVVQPVILQPPKSPEEVTLQAPLPPANKPGPRASLPPELTIGLEDAEGDLAMAYMKYAKANNPKLLERDAYSMARQFLSEEKRHNLPQGILPAIAHVESRYRLRAKSKANAYGLMQVQPRTALFVDKKYDLGILKGLKAELDQIKPGKLAKGASLKARKANWRKYANSRKTTEKEIVAKIIQPENNIRLGAAALRFHLKVAGDLQGSLEGYSGNAKNYANKVLTAHKTLLAKGNG